MHLEIMLQIDRTRLSSMRHWHAQVAAHRERASRALELADGTRHLSSNVFQGRASGTAGGAKASAWVATRMAAAGLSPWQRHGYYQSVPMISSSLINSAFNLCVNGVSVPIRAGDDDQFLFRTCQGEVELDRCDIVFVGYGIVAPEYGWDDYCAVNMRGKIALVITGEPKIGYLGQSSFQPGRATYYSRWQYKLDEAARQGAAGAIVLHSEKQTGYAFRLIHVEMSRPYRFLRTSLRQQLQFEAWCSEKWARELFSRVRLNLECCIEACNNSAFRPFSLGAQLSLTAIARKAPSFCRNVIGILPGRVTPREIVLIVAHWDHLGMFVSSEGSTKTYPGAVDNAVGVSMLLSLARSMCGEVPPRRSICFASTTGEEVGLIGSEHFASHLLARKTDVILAINIDGFLPIGRTRDILLCDGGLTNIRNEFRRVAKRYGRTVRTDENYAAGYFYRSDQVNFAKVGIPAVQLSSGSHLLGDPVLSGAERHKKYYYDKYHTTSDKFDPSWSFESLSNDVSLIAGVVRAISNSAWRPTELSAGAF